LHSSFARAANYAAGAKLLCTVGPEAGPGPLNLVFDDFDAQLLGASVELAQDGVLSAGGLAFDTRQAQRYDSALPSAQNVCSRAQENAGKFLSLLLKKAPELSFARALEPQPGPESGFAGELMRAAREGMELLQKGHYYDAARKLRGTGVGLTPSGDDFLCGYLLGINVLEHAHGKNLNYRKQTIYGAALSGRNPLTDAFLSCACEGGAGWRIKQLFEAMAGTAAVTPQRAVEAAIDHGATSGADTAAGFIFALTREHDDD
jgi:hypothetical protein